MRTTRKTATELQVEILRHWRKPLYYLAPIAQVNPCTMGQMINERIPMPRAVKQRILAALAEEARKRRAGLIR